MIKMKIKPIYPIALAMLTLAITACDPRGPKMQSSTTGQMYNDPKWGGMRNFEYDGQETGPGLVLIEGGSFTMGNLENDLMYDHNTSERAATVHSFYMDETEVSNQQYREFEYWYQRVFDPNVAFFNGTLDFAGRSFDPNANGGQNYLYYLILPDTNCWRSKLGYNEPFVEYYYRHPAYKDYPVVGVNWHQAREFAKWRTDRVNEYILDREGIMCFNVGNDYLVQNPNDNFNTRAYLAGQDNGVFSGQPGQGPAVAGQSIKPANDNMLGSKPLRNYRPAKRKDQDRYKVTMEDGILSLDYRLPTEAEWEYASKAAIGSTQFENIDENKVYTWNDYTIRIKNGKESDRGKIRANLMRGKGDNAGIAGGPLNDGGIITTPVYSYWPNAYGLYNMEGNVSEWVMDVYRKLSVEDMDGFMPFRGNKFEQVRTDANSFNQGNLVDKDDLGRIIYTDVEKTNINSGGRRNYSEADNIGFGDDQEGFDMLGNNTPDTYATFYNKKDDKFKYIDNNDKGAYGFTSLIDDQARVYKGGNWTDRMYFATPGTRRFLEETMATSFIGFRCAMFRVGSPVGNNARDYNELPSSGGGVKTKK